MYTTRDLDGLVGFGFGLRKVKVALLRLLGRTRTQWVQTPIKIVFKCLNPYELINIVAITLEEE